MHTVLAISVIRMFLVYCLLFSKDLFSVSFWFGVFETGSLFSPGCPGTRSVHRTGLELTEICLLLPRDYEDQRCMQPHSAMRATEGPKLFHYLFRNSAIISVVVLVCFPKIGFLCVNSPSWSRTHSVNQAGLELTEIHLPQSPKC